MATHFFSSPQELKGIENRKALILLEESSSLGDTATQYFNHAYSLSHPGKGDIFDEINHIILKSSEYQDEVDEKNKERNQIEETMGENSKEFIQIEEQIKSMEAELRKINIKKNKILEQHYPDIIEVLQTQGIDLVIYDAKEDPNNPRALVYNLNKIINDVLSVAANNHYDYLVIAGGHGYTDVISGFMLDDYHLLLQKMDQNNIKAKIIALGSCESACNAFLTNKFLGDENSIVLCAMGDCAKSSFHLEAVNQSLNNTEFFDSLNYQPNSLDIYGTTLGILEKDSLTIFDVPQTAKEIDEFEYEGKNKEWSTSFNDLLMRSPQKAASDTPHLGSAYTINILGTKNLSNQATELPDAIKLTEQTHLIYEDKNINSLNMVVKEQNPLHLELTSDSKKELAAKMYEEVMGDPPDDESDEFYLAIYRSIPNVNWIEFSDNPQTRMEILNLILKEALHKVSLENTHDITAGSVIKELAKLSLQGPLPADLLDQLVEARKIKAREKLKT